MYPQTLYPKTKQVLEKLEKLELNNFYLAGGTALALQLGHRKSIDLDFFTDNFPKRDILLQKLHGLNPTITQEAQGTLDVLIEEVKVSFLEYKYPLVCPLVKYGKTELADITDIACMKLTAISSRGSKKDFIDLYFILKTRTLNEVIEVFRKKFEGVDYQETHILKSLVFFEDANRDPDPDYIESINWEEVKDTLEKTVENFIRSL
jgi:hypothetical protein